MKQLKVVSEATTKQTQKLQVCMSKLSILSAHVHTCKNTCLLLKIVYEYGRHCTLPNKVSKMLICSKRHILAATKTS